MIVLVSQKNLSKRLHTPNFSTDARKNYQIHHSIKFMALTLLTSGTQCMLLGLFCKNVLACCGCIYSKTNNWTFPIASANRKRYKNTYEQRQITNLSEKFFPNANVSFIRIHNTFQKNMRLYLVKPIYMNVHKCLCYFK